MQGVPVCSLTELPASVDLVQIRPDRLDRLRAICLALPQATEKETWGDPTWRVNNRIFAMQKGNHAGGRPNVLFKAAKGFQAVLVGADCTRFFIPPYVGHKGWVGVYLDQAEVDWEELIDLIADSYRLIAAKRLRIGWVWAIAVLSESPPNLREGRS